MFAGSLVMGLSMVGFAVWLQWNDSIGWSSESMESRLEAEYLIRRSRSRSRIHLMIGGCGVMITAAAFAGPRSPQWAAAWMSVIVALMVIVMLAILDAWRTHRYHAAKRPEIRRENFGD
jgi:peptidoglycan/LPS O-acetylase OafA/YrhL